MQRNPPWELRCTFFSPALPCRATGMMQPLAANHRNPAAFPCHARGIAVGRRVCRPNRRYDTPLDPTIQHRRRCRTKRRTRRKEAQKQGNAAWMQSSQEAIVSPTGNRANDPDILPAIGTTGNIRFARKPSTQPGYSTPAIGTTVTGGQVISPRRRSCARQFRSRPGAGWCNPSPRGWF